MHNNEQVSGIYLKKGVRKFSCKTTFSIQWCIPTLDIGKKLKMINSHPLLTGKVDITALT